MIKLETPSLFRCLVYSFKVKAMLMERTTIKNKMEYWKGNLPYKMKLSLMNHGLLDPTVYYFVEPKTGIL